FGAGVPSVGLLLRGNPAVIKLQSPLPTFVSFPVAARPPAGRKRRDYSSFAPPPAGFFLPGFGHWSRRPIFKSARKALGFPGRCRRLASSHDRVYLAR